MNETKSSMLKRPHKKNAIITLVLIITILGGFAGIGSGVLQYAIAAVGCLRAPVVASRFMASYSYILPGEDGYGPGVFNEYYCSEQAAKNAGFRPGVSTETGEAEDQARQKQQEEAERFSPSKVDFTAYIPSGNVYSAGKLRLSKMSGGDNQLFFPLKKDGSNVANVREGRAPNSYELCNRAEDRCETMGTDASGHVIKKQTNKNRREETPYYSYGVIRGDTFINLEGVSSSDLSDADVLAIINSLTEYKSE